MRTGPSTGSLKIPVVTDCPFHETCRGSPTLTESTLMRRSPPGRAGSGVRSIDLVLVEAFDLRSDLVEPVLYGEMAAVEHVQLGLREVPQVGAAALGGEEDVVLSPEDERLRPALAQERLPLRIERDVRAIVVEEVELDLAGAGAFEEV